MVESIANTGIFGPAYLDNDHAGVLPTLLAGLALVLAIGALRAIALLRQPVSGKACGWRGVAAYLSTGSRASDYALVLALQLTAVCAIENAEQFAAHGTFVSGLTWLGAPVLVSLVAHGGIAAAALRLVQGLTRALADACRSLVRVVLAFMLLGRRTTPAAFGKRQQAFFALARAARVRRTRGRAPPFSPTPA